MKLANSYLYILFFFVITSSVISQNTDVTFELTYSVTKFNEMGDEENFREGKLVIYKDSVKLNESQLFQNKKYSSNFEYGHVYSLYFSAQNCYDMFLILNLSNNEANEFIKSKTKYVQGCELIKLPFYDKKIKESQLPYIDKFSSHPFQIIEYNSATKDFSVNKQYTKDFRSNSPKSVYQNYMQNIFKRSNNKLKSIKQYCIAGKFSLGSDPSVPLKKLHVKLLNSKSEIINTCITNGFGQFYFEKIEKKNEYAIVVDEGDQLINANKAINFTNKYNNIIEKTVSDANGYFKFRMQSNDTSKLNLLSVENNNLIISGNLLAILNGKASALQNKKLNLLIQGNTIIETTETNEFGTFVFTKLPHDEIFMIKPAESDIALAGMKVMITDRNGKTINETTADAKGGFNFEFLEPEKSYIPLMEVDDSQLKVNFKGKLINGDKQPAPISNTSISLLNSTENAVNTTTTDNGGNFSFNYVEKAPLYYLSTETSEILQKISIADANGVIVKEYQNGKKIKTIKLPLLSAEQTRLGTVYVDDPWLKIIHKSTDVKSGYVIPEKVYFEVNDFKITPEAQNILDKVAQVMKSAAVVKIEISSHTDSKGSDQYNMELSQKRAKSAVDYLVAQGIDKTRLSGIGYGETKLINHCKNDVACSEDEHAQNRRLEFKIISQ